ncbi:MAG: NYN domain-containing protein [Methanobacteriaceae archaeon]
MKVIIDGSNLAHHNKGEGKAKLNNIAIAVKKLEKDGEEFAIIADAPLKHEIDNKEDFEKLVENGDIIVVPRGTDADHFILNLASKENSKILSNDNFREYFDEFKDINSMRIPYSIDIKKGEIKFGESKKPKKDKNILQNICASALTDFENKRYEVFYPKQGIEFSPLNIARESIERLGKVNDNATGAKIEGIFSKIPLIGKIMSMVDDVEASAPLVIFVLLHPKDYKEAISNAGNISVTIGDRLNLTKNPFIAVRNDLFIKPGRFELNIIYSDEVEEEAPFNIDIRVNSSDELFIKKNSRNIASTVAGRIASWKFPIVSVKTDMLLEKPGDFELELVKSDITTLQSSSDIGGKNSKNKGKFNKGGD